MGTLSTELYDVVGRREIGKLRLVYEPGSFSDLLPMTSAAARTYDATADEGFASPPETIGKRFAAL